MRQVDYNTTSLRRKYTGKSFLMLLLFAFLHSLTGVAQTTYYSLQAGNWNSTSMWSTSPKGASCNCIPSTGNIVISSGHTVTIPNNYSPTILGNVTIQSTAVLDLKSILSIGSATNCGYSLDIETGGKLIESGPGNGEKVKICGKIILSANPGGLYQIPSSGIIGPVAYSEAGQETILPVVLKSFDLRALASGVELNWETTMELNNAGFEIQRSTDGFQSFDVAGFVDGFGSSSTERIYSFVDTKASGSTLYYRLKQIDFDGQFNFSEIKFINFAKRDVEQVLYPNPTAGSVTVNLKEVESAGSVQYSIIGPDGQVKVSVKTCTGNGISAALSNDISALNPGTYTVVFGTSQTRQSVKLIKI
jgi:hypothetical protein